jgi:hypothetical protein
MLGTISSPSVKKSSNKVSAPKNNTRASIGYNTKNNTDVMGLVYSKE